MNKTPEDEEFERIERESGWRKRQIEQSELCSNYGGFCKKEWVGLTDEEILNFRPRYKFSKKLLKEVETILKEKNT